MEAQARHGRKKVIKSGGFRQSETSYFVTQNRLLRKFFQKKIQKIIDIHDLKCYNKNVKKKKEPDERTEVEKNDSSSSRLHQSRM